MSKVVLGIITAAVWFALSQAASAERVCKQVCDHGSCVSRCVDNPDTTIIEHRDHPRDDRGPEGPGIHIDVGH